MTRINGTWLDAPETRKVMTALAAEGHEAYFVGGCVRNPLLGEPVSDVDIATNARPETVMRLSEAAGLRAVPTGIDHGTITVVSGELGFEVTTYRRDVESDGRRAVVAYADTMIEDAHRRDFTMNALYADASGVVIDPLGEGLSDAAARRVRFIDDPQARIREDYLRILRFFRFHAWYGAWDEGFDIEALDAISRHSAGIETLSRERVGHEMLKLLAAPDPTQSLSTMAATGILQRVLPGADPRSVGPLIVAEAAFDLEADPVRRLAALGGDGVREALRMSRADAACLARLRETATSTAGAAEIGYRLGAAEGLGAIALRSALIEEPVDPSSIEDVLTGAAQEFPVVAADLMDEFSGPDLGARLKELKAAWIASGFALTRDALLALD